MKQTRKSIFYLQFIKMECVKLIYVIITFVRWLNNFEVREIKISTILSDYNHSHFYIIYTRTEWVIAL